jgi:hypothetical protein
MLSQCGCCHDAQGQGSSSVTFEPKLIEDLKCKDAVDIGEARATSTVTTRTISHLTPGPESLSNGELHEEAEAEPLPAEHPQTVESISQITSDLQPAQPEAIHALPGVTNPHESALFNQSNTPEQNAELKTPNKGTQAGPAFNTTTAWPSEMKQTSSVTVSPAAPSRGKGGCFDYLLHSVTKPRNSTYLGILASVWYTRWPQFACSILATAVFAIIGGALYAQGQKMYEVSIAYTSSDVSLEFNLEQDLNGDVLIQYALPGVTMNHKQFIESKDPKIATPLLNKVQCNNADSQDWARFKRSDDSTFLARINGTPSLLPCGLVSLSMFTDTFTIDKFDPNQGLWLRLGLDEADIALPADSKTYSKKISDPGTGSSLMVIGGETSWISSGSFYEHWKVWQRTPASPHVRNLWAVFHGGMQQGKYKLNIGENSPIWHTWGVAQKFIFISSTHTLGSKGALLFLGPVCIALAIFEALLALVLLLVPSLVNSRKYSA